MKLVDPTNPTFRELHNVVEQHYRELHEKRIGATIKQAKVVSREDEQAFKSVYLGLIPH